MIYAQDIIDDLKKAIDERNAEIDRLRERVRICSGALTPVSENEKRGMQRVLAILDRKIAEGGGMVSSDVAAVERHNAHHRARWSAFSECAMMLRSALQRETAQSEPKPAVPS
jgi:hypothetical protein